MARRRKSRKSKSGSARQSAGLSRRRRRPRRPDAKLAFESLAIEGALLSPEWLARVAQLQADIQSAADYRVPKGLTLRDEIGRYWRIAQAYWQDFSTAVRRHEDSNQARSLAETLIHGLLRESFGFSSLVAVEPTELDGRVYPIGFAALEGRVPVVLAPDNIRLDEPSDEFGEEGRRRSAFGLCQDYLNAEDRALWGLVSNGKTLRIVRDNASLTRPAWLEADLARMFTEERYADFAALWLLCHETRFGRSDQPVTECALESWRKSGIEQGTRARKELRRGVEDALLALGNGFLNHPGNTALRTALAHRKLDERAYYQELLRLVYRLIFLLTAEERNVLHPNDSAREARELYAEGYSLRKLRERALRRSAHDRFSDQWEAVKIVFRSLATGEPRLALPALAGIFATEQCPMLDNARIENRALLTATFHLSWLREKVGLERVNWRDMGPEELGGVYESLLELVPRINLERRMFTFATGAETRDDTRKKTGSYYTPEGLVQVLLDSALEPVIEGKLASHPDQPVEALLELTIVDPSCGSGHFLLAAARRLAAHIARLQSDGTPSPREYRHALRQVISRCIYGVDLNPLAVELCKVSLWMEAVEPGLPLTFLDSHIRHGNALFGATPALMDEGIPDSAWTALEGDDKKTAKALKKRNKQQRSGQLGLELGWLPSAAGDIGDVTRAMQALDATLDVTLPKLLDKQTRWQEILASDAYKQERMVADIWCAAFVWPKQSGPGEDAAPTQELWRGIRDTGGQPPALTLETATSLSEQYRFFHWHLAFAPVLARGGFDVVLGNPPWERVKLQEREFFAARSEEIANARNAAARKKLIKALPHADPTLWEVWCEASRQAQGVSHFARESGRYPLCGRGDINTYALFAEHNREILNPYGYTGFIVPTGIATDATTQEYFRSLLDHDNLRSLYDFQTGPETFGNLAHGAMRFSLITLSTEPMGTPLDLFFYAKSPTDLQNAQRHFSLTTGDFVTLNPNTRTCPTFQTRRDADINLAMYRLAGVLWREDDPDGNPWGLELMAMLHMSNDSALFRSRAELESIGLTLVGNILEGEGKKYLPLYEAKMIDHFDHRYASLIGVDAGGGRKSRKLVGWYAAIGEDPTEFAQPRYWVQETEVDSRLQERWQRDWLLGWRDICRSTDQRTVIASLIPRAATGDTFLLAMPTSTARLTAALYGNLCSMALDYAARQKVGGTHLKYHVFKQLPVLPPQAYEVETPWLPQQSLNEWLLARVIELTYTAWDLEPFARDCGYEGAPFRWNGQRRALLRAELDAAFFHLYGLDSQDTAHVLDSFPIVRNNDEKIHCEYRTKRVILEIHDAMNEAIQTGRPYHSILPGPPQNHESATHR